MIEQNKPLSEITSHTIHVLCKEIGVVNTTRFINQFTMDYRNYTEEHELWFADMTLNEIISEIKPNQTQQT